MDAILKSQFLSLYCMVLADGVIDARELETLYKIGIEQYGLTQSEIIDTIKNAGSSFLVPSTLEGKIRFLFNMVQIAYADGEVDASEEALLKKYIAKMEFADENIDGIADFLLDAVKNGITEKDIISRVIQ
ncbi:hypothetical protein [uncultured Duncaniella sp.]|uniref:hypothetical protein n=1 Tax=uncultured Duncaniella sp. TaxID=2768039 RepID=UPI0025F2270E|nr:hypothetical protein [uncultured Duncaniella sp.]